jgi:hypothetical protein
MRGIVSIYRQSDTSLLTHVRRYAEMLFRRKELAASRGVEEEDVSLSEVSEMLEEEDQELEQQRADKVWPCPSFACKYKVSMIFPCVLVCTSVGSSCSL